MDKSMEESIDQFYDENIRKNSWFYFGTPPAITTTEKLQLFFNKYKELQNTEIEKCRAVKMGFDKVNNELREENDKLLKIIKEGLLTETQQKDLEEFEHLKEKITILYQKYYKDQGKDLNFVNKIIQIFIKNEGLSASEKLDELNEAFDKVITYCNERINIVANDIEKIFKSAELTDAVTNYYDEEIIKTGNVFFVEDHRTNKIVKLIENLKLSNKTLEQQVSEAKEIENNLRKENSEAVTAYFDNIFNIRGNLKLNTGMGSEERNYANPYTQYLQEINESIENLVKNSEEVNEVKSIINSAYATEETRKDFLSGIIDKFQNEVRPHQELNISEKLKIFYRAYDALSNEKIEICEEIKQRNKEIAEKLENYNLNWINKNADILKKNVTVIKNLVGYSALSSIQLNIDLVTDSTINESISLYTQGVETEKNLNTILVYLENSAMQQNTFLQKSFENLKNSKATLLPNIINKQENISIKNTNELLDFVNKKIKSYEYFIETVIEQMKTRGDITNPEIDSYSRENYNKNKSAIENELDFLESKILDMCDKLTGAEIKQQNIEEQSKIYISGLSQRYSANEKQLQLLQNTIANIDDVNLKKKLETLKQQNSKALDEITEWQKKENIIVKNGIILLKNLQKENNDLKEEQAEFKEKLEDCDILKQQLIAVQDEIKYQQDKMQTLTQDRRAVMEKYKLVAEKLKSIVTDEESLADINKEVYDATVKIDLSQEETIKTIKKLQDEKKGCEDKIEAMTAEMAENEKKIAQMTEENKNKLTQITKDSKKIIEPKTEETEKKPSTVQNVAEAVQTVFEKYYGKVPIYAEKIRTQIESRMSLLGQSLSLKAESPRAEVRVLKAMQAPDESPKVDVKKQLKQSISNIRQSTALWLSR